MFDIGWPELSIIALVALFVIGPKDLPKVFRTVGRWVAQVRGMAKEFQQSVEEAVRESELDDVKREIEQIGRTDVKKQIQKTVDPKGELDEVISPFDSRAKSGNGSSSSSSETVSASTTGSAGNTAQPAEKTSTPAAEPKQATEVSKSSADA
ncbi:MAG: twin-arginine translocase subunit TatB [Rhodospirillaceae bacterium]|nr:twin-arginine translocase subunit TatB [Rhodospirillaceae bacterium]